MVSCSRMNTMAAVAVVLLCALVSVDAHGWLSSPPSRQDQCHSGAVKNCGEIQYEPQSVEALKGKMTCNGDVAQWAVLADNTMPWVTTPVGSGINTFAWTQTAIHIAADWEYYINNTLIAKFLGTANTIHCVDLTGYHGYQKILAVWNIGDTADAFYSCVDVNIGAGTGSGSSCVGGGASVFTPVTNTGCTTSTQTSSYIVASGDTLVTISAATGVTLAALLTANPLKTAASVLEVGTTVIIPSSSNIVCTGSPVVTPTTTPTSAPTTAPTSAPTTTPTTTPTTAPTTKPTTTVKPTTAPTTAPTSAPCTAGTQSYTVKTGDNLLSIAAAKGLTSAQILAANPRLTTTGTTLIIPSGSKTTCATGCKTSVSTTPYTVVSGDSMSAIAAAKGITLTGFIEANPTVVNPALIYIGQVLNVPTYTTSCSTVSGTRTRLRF